MEKKDQHTLTNNTFVYDPIYAKVKQFNERFPRLGMVYVGGQFNVACRTVSNNRLFSFDEDELMIPQLANYSLTYAELVGITNVMSWYRAAYKEYWDKMDEINTNEMKESITGFEGDR